MIQIEVEGRAAPKGSRIASKTKAGKLYTYPASKHEKPWVDAVREAARIAMRHHPTPEPPYDVDLCFYLARPTTRKPAYAWPTRHDADKLARAVIDGLVQGGAMEDDRHVTALTIRKCWADARVPGVTAQIDTAASVRLAA